MTPEEASDLLEVDRRAHLANRAMTMFAKI